MRAVVPPEMDGQSVRQAVERLAEGVPRWAVRQALREKQARLDGVRVGGEARVCAGQELRVYFPKEALSPRAPGEIDVVYEDAHVLLVAKPQGLPAQDEGDPARGDTALTRARVHISRSGGKTDHVLLCHRLDVQTGGLLLLAKDEAAYEAALRAFEARAVRKRYQCLVKGCPALARATLRAYLRKDEELSRVSVTDAPKPGAREIVTAYEVMEAGEERSRLAVDLITGRTHQIRAHLAHIGHPVLGDDKYGDRALNRRLGLRRQQLWSWLMTFDIPDQSDALAYLNGRVFEAPCPF